jgi:16S rRNA G1207 methylase RsmC
MSIPKSRPTNSKAEAPVRPGHYFDREPAVASRPRVVQLRVDAVELELQADRGVFGSKGVDLGTVTLLKEAPAPPANGEILDLGSGYGPIALTLARRSPNARVWAVDVNERALELTRLNAAAAQASNVVVGKPDEVPADLQFDAIYSNPPVRVGKAPLHELLLTWLPRLRPGAPAYLVVQRNLGSDSLATWLAGEGFQVERLKSKKGYRILEVKVAGS